jgi:hypothetical protein
MEGDTTGVVDPGVSFPSESLRPFCSLSRSFEKPCARPSCSLSGSFERWCARPSCSMSRSFETRFSNGSLSRFDRGGSPNGGAVAFRLRLAELSQLSQSPSGFLAQPACARVRGRYAELGGFGVALRTRGVGPPACQQARPGGCSAWSQAVKNPDRLC